MYLTDFVSLISAIISCTFFIFCIVGGIWFIKKILSSSSSQPKQSTNTSSENYETIKWLVRQKANGYNTINELINALQSQNPLQSTATALTKEIKQTDNYNNSKENVVVTPPQATVNKGLFDQFNAKVLLYLGSTLVVFAIFILVAFNWESFPNLFKSSVLISVTAGFYILGYYLHKKAHLKDAGITFILIASISFGLLGFGLWTFGIKDLGIDFNWYWFYYSIVTISVYTFTYHLLKVKNLYYLLIVSIYGFFVSTAFLLTQDMRFRIAVFLVLNYLLYLITIRYKERQIVGMTTRVLNQALNVIVIGTILLNIDNLGSIEIKIAACVALLIPILFEITSYIRDKSETEIHISIISLPIKLLMIADIFAIDNGFKLVIFIMLICTYTLISEIIDYYQKDKKELMVSLKGISWVICFIITAIIAQNWVAPDALNIGVDIKIFSVISVLLVLILPELIAKRKIAFSVLSIYILFAFARIFSIAMPTADLQVFVILMSATLLGFTLLQVGIKSSRKTLVVPIIIANIITVAILALITQNYSYILLGAVCINIPIVANLIIFKLKELRFLTVVINMVIFYSFIQCLIQKGIMTSSLEIVGLAFLIPATIYAYALEVLNYHKKENLSEIFGFVSFVILSLGYSIYNSTYLTYVLGFILLYSIYALFRFKKQILSYVVFFLSNIFVYSLSSIISFDTIGFIESLMYLSILWAFYMLLSKLKWNETITNPFKVLAFRTSIIALPILVICILITHILRYEIIVMSLSLFIVFIMSHEIFEVKIGLSGISLLFIVFHVSFINSAHIDYYVFAISIYLLAMSYAYYLKSHAVSFKDGLFILGEPVNLAAYKNGIILENLGYIITFLTFLIQSMSDVSDTFKFVTGGALILLCIGILFLGFYRKNKDIILLTIIFITLELIVRLYVFILSIPWWIYLGLIGMALISLAIYMINRNAKKQI